MTDRTNALFTTGQVTGMLGISLASLQLYIREYGHYLSDTASQHKQGRRYTGQDIECLMTIRNLRFRRTDKATIEAVLRGDETSTEPVYKVSDMANLVAQMAELEKIIRRQAWEISQKTKLVESTHNQISYISKTLHEQQESFGTDFSTVGEKVQSLADQIAKLDRRIEMLEYNRPFTFWEWIADKFGL